MVRERMWMNPGGWLALGGGDEFGQACVKGDRALIEVADVRSVVLLPTAQADGHSDPERAGNHGARYFRNLGLESKVALIRGREDAQDTKLVAALGDADMVYINGGNPGYLYQALKDTLAWETIMHAWRNGAALVGSSAGAMILCQAMFGPPAGIREPWTPAFGLVPHTLAAVHHERAQDSVGLDTLRTLPDGYTVLGIDACNIAAWAPDGTWHMMGEGRVRAYGPSSEVPEVYTHGQMWRL